MLTDEEKKAKEEEVAAELERSRLDAEETKRKNRELCEKYPFLIPSNRWSGIRITEAEGGGYWPGDPDAIPEYDYEFTELDDMPDGWRIAFGEQMCEELKRELLKYGGEKALQEYRIVQVKEKYGQLRWYTDWTSDMLEKIVDRYTELSERTCIRCGKPATQISTGWISPWCDECAKQIPYRMVPVDVWFRGSEDKDETETDGETETEASEEEIEMAERLELHDARMAEEDAADGMQNELD